MTLVDDFIRELDAVRIQHAGRPADELVWHMLLALEREEVVSVAYREAVIDQRLAGMPVDPAVKELIQQALVWAWKDEQMHARYVHGAIIRLGRPVLRLLALARQTNGIVAGWATAVQHHSRPADAPVSRLIARAIITIGELLGQVPEDIRTQIRYQPFRDYCLLNVELERTAGLGWTRAADVAATAGLFPPTLVTDFRRIVEDEHRHESVFGLIAEVLDEDDRLRPGVTAGSILERLQAIGQPFIPRRYRQLDTPIGQGGTVAVQSTNPINPLTKSIVGSFQPSTFNFQLSTAVPPSLESALRRADLAGLLTERARERGKRLSDLSIAIKTTFMLGYDRQDRGTHVDPALIQALAGWLWRWGCNDISVIEGPNLYDWYFQNRSVARVADYLGFRSPYYRIVDASQEQVAHAYPHGLGQHTIARTWRDADVRIVVGKARSNPTEHLFATIAALENLGERVDKYLFPERQVQLDTATMMILADLPPHFALLDAFTNVPDGLVGMLGSRHAVSPGRFYAGRDALAVDSLAAAHFGLDDPRRTNLLSTAYAWFGDPRPLTIVDGPDTPVTGWRGPFSDDLSTLICLPALPVYQYLSGRGSLFTPPMDPAAFPPKSAVSPQLWLGRKAVQVVFGIRPPRKHPALL